MRDVDGAKGRTDMDQSLLALVSGLVGALIGAASSVATILIQSHYQSKRELRRMALDAAIADCEQCFEAAKTLKREAEVAPLTAFLHFHVRYMQLLDSGKLNAESLKALKDERDQLFQK